MQHREPYNSDVSDREWTIIRQYLPQRGRLGRPPRYERREVFNATMYVTKTGCPWRYLPHDFPRWRTLPVGRSWDSGSPLTMPFGKRSVRRALKKAPSAAILDAQTVKMADQPRERGFDAGKKVKGRKRHLLVDTPGPDLVAVVHSAAIQDRDGAKLVIQKARWFGWLSVIFADAAYSGQLVTWVREFFGRQGTRLSIIPTRHDIAHAPYKPLTLPGTFGIRPSPASISDLRLGSPFSLTDSRTPLHR
jgi:putative transposase